VAKAAPCTISVVPCSTEKSSVSPPAVVESVHVTLTLPLLSVVSDNTVTVPSPDGPKITEAPTAALPFESVA
jgi:hypothetical protein